MDLRERLGEFGGAARRADFVRTWADRQELARLVGEGGIVDHGGGCYALPGAPEWIVRARQFRGAATCITWARLNGLAVLETSRRIHLAVPANRSAKRSACRPAGRVVLHRTPEGRGGEPPVVARPEAALGCLLRCLEPLPAIVTVDSALNRGMCTEARIRSELVGPGSVRARLTLSRCDSRSASLLESLARLELVAAGLQVSTGVQIDGVGWVDIVVEGRIVVELDGFEFHSSRTAFGNDRRRDRVLASLGYVVLRFTYDEVVTLPGYVAAQVLAVLGRPGISTQLRRPLG